MAIVLAATGAFVQQRLQSNLDRAIDRSLRARAADVAALAQQSDTGLSEARRGATAGKVQLAQLIDPSGRVLDRTPGLSRQPLLDAAAVAAVRRSGAHTQDAQLGARGPVRLLAQPARAQDQALVIVVGQPLGDRNRALSDLRGVMLVGGPAALVLASLAGYLLIGAALRPVEAMRRRAASISAHELDQRLPPAGGDDEIGRLGRTLNEMLERIQAAVVRERTLVSDASHELRSPLATLRAELELIALERPTGPALQGAVGSAIEETDRLARLAEDLLLLARADDRRLALRIGPVSVAELLQEAADRGSRRPSAAGKRIEVDVPVDTAIRVDRDRIAQALDNLVANALRHADSRVSLGGLLRPGLVELHVADDGRGFPPDFLVQAWERFSRADAARTEDGAGLGLAIVRSIVEAHGGVAGAANRDAGGADVWLTLPRAPKKARVPEPHDGPGVGAT